MKKLRFVKYNPAQNMTVLVLDAVDRSDHQSLAVQIMAYENVYAEQVAFIEWPQTPRGKAEKLLRLQMMGGEFCGNAARALASYLVSIDHPSALLSGDHYHVRLEASGVEDVVSAKVWVRPDGFHDVEVEMPLPLSVGRLSLSPGAEERAKRFRRVDFPGISHIIVHHSGFDANHTKRDQEPLFQAVKAALKEEGVEAFGLMFYDDKNQFLTPLVYVSGTDSLFWEKSCATGTAAVGVSVSADRRESVGMQLIQPGGSLGVRVFRRDDRIHQIHLKGPVKRVADGWLYL